ncbi:MAG: glycine betaine ABC transporter substrate-binding protein [Ktedonobacteraceae bacterium]|jgi:osmoprotectant transport system substrate-binding protein
MTKKMTLAFMMISALVVLLTSCGLSPSTGSTSSPGSSNSAGGTIIVGSKSFTENILVGDMMYDLLLANLKGVTIQNKSNLGGTMVPWNALQSGQIDMYCEYTGTGLVDILKQPVQQDPNQVYNTVKQQYPPKFHIDWMQPLGFNDTYAVAVPTALAQKYHLKTISDLAAVAPQFVFGAEPEYYTRPDGYPGLTKEYGLHFKSTKSINVGLKYEAAGSNQVQVLDVFSTDAQLIQYNMVVLQDDKSFFPPYYAAPIVREDILNKYPQVTTILNMLASKLDNTAMQRLNYDVDVQHQSATSVAKQFLVSKGLLSA